LTDYHWELLRLERLAMIAGMLPSTPRAWRRQWNREAWALREPAPHKEPKPPKSQRPLCGATTRKGTPCKARVVQGSTRCRVHGGLSTGPRTDAGREAIRASNRRRAALADLEELAPDVDDERRRRWADAIGPLARDYPHNLGGEHGGEVAEAEAAGVGVETIARWRENAGFAEAERRAGWRMSRRHRRNHRTAAREARGGMYTMPIESTCIDLDTLPEFDLDAAVANLPDFTAEDLAELLAVDPLEGLALDAIMGELPPLDLEKLLEDLGDPLEGLLDGKPPPVEDIEEPALSRPPSRDL